MTGFMEGVHRFREPYVTHLVLKYPRMCHLRGYSLVVLKSLSDKRCHSLKQTDGK